MAMVLFRVPALGRSRQGQDLWRRHAWRTFQLRHHQIPPNMLSNNEQISSKSNTNKGSNSSNGKDGMSSRGIIETMVTATVLSMSP